MTAFDALHEHTHVREDSLNWHADGLVFKYSPDQVAWATISDVEPSGSQLMSLFDEPEDGYAYVCGNLLVTVGLNLITSLMIGGGGQALTHTATLTGVGDTATAATVADTQLGSNSSNHSQYIVADTSNPSQSNGVISNQSTFSTSVANFTWAEWCWVSAASAANSVTFASTGTSPIMINHKISSLGTKVSGASWVFQTSVTLS